MKLITHFEQHLTRTNIIMGIIFVLFINVIAFPLFPNLFDTDIPLQATLDLHFGFSPHTVYLTLQNLSQKQREVYLFSTLIIDIPYAMVYWTVYTFILLSLIKALKISDKYKKLAIIPLFISIFDLIENAGIIYFLTSFPNINPTLVPIFSAANMIKWIFAILTLTTISGLLLLWIKRKLIKT